MCLYWRNSDDWGLSAASDETLRLEQVEEEAAIAALGDRTLALTDTDINLYMRTLDIDHHTGERMVAIQRKIPSERTNDEVLFLRSVLLQALATSDEVDFVEGQLLPHGASHELIRAVRNGDDKAIAEELQKVKDPEKLAVLTRITQRMGPILGRQR